MYVYRQIHPTHTRCDTSPADTEDTSARHVERSAMIYTLEMHACMLTFDNRCCAVPTHLSLHSGAAESDSDLYAPH